MPWVRLDEEFPDHPKVVTAGPLAGWLHVCALAYCNRHLTDGFVPHAQIARLVNFAGIIDLDEDPGPMDARDLPDVSPYDLAKRLVALGMWEQLQGGYLIHDFLDYQPSRAEIEAQRKVKKDAGRAGGIRSGESRRSKPEAEAKQTPKHTGTTAGTRPEAELQAKGEAKSKPVPVPVPDALSNSSSSSLDRVVGQAADDDEDELRKATTALIADRRIALTTQVIKSPRAYRAQTLRSVEEELGDDLRRLLGEGWPPEAVAEALCPAPPPAAIPYPPMGEVREPAFDVVEDEHGGLVAVPRRTG